MKFVKCFILTMMILAFSAFSLEKYETQFSLNIHKLNWIPVKDSSKSNDLKYQYLLLKDNTRYIYLMKLPEFYIHPKHIYLHSISFAVIAGDLIVHVGGKNPGRFSFYEPPISKNLKLEFLSTHLVRLNKNKILKMTKINSKTPVVTKSNSGALVLMETKMPLSIQY